MKVFYGPLWGNRHDFEINIGIKIRKHWARNVYELNCGLFYIGISTVKLNNK